MFVTGRTTRILWVLTAIWLVPPQAWGEVPCPVTPEQTEGPFYPVEDQPDKDGDLTVLPGHAERATGPRLYIAGRVRDVRCRPVEGAIVEIWQAAASGRYKHPDDRNAKARHDPHFQHWGIVRTDKEGRFSFKTVMPSPYPASFVWTRPAHIHYKVHRKGSPVLTTQMYFEGDPYLERDLIYKDIPSASRPLVVVRTRKAEGAAEPDALACSFEIVLP